MPKDFTKKSFTRTIRGYSPEDVDKYLEAINGEYGKLEKHSAENERRLLFALRKLESLTKELQSIYSSAEAVEKEHAPEVREPAVSEDGAAVTERKAELRSLEDEVAKAKAELGSVKIETEKLRTAAEERARTLLGAARARGDSIILEARAKSDAIVAASAKKARAAAEQIITDAALASRKMIRDAEAKADDACRDLTTIYTAAERMYKEVSEFRSDVFSLYSNHISSIESISGTANGMLDTVNRIVEELEAGESALPPAKDEKTVGTSTETAADIAETVGADEADTTADETERTVGGADGRGLVFEPDESFAGIAETEDGDSADVIPEEELEEIQPEEAIPADTVDEENEDDEDDDRTPSQDIYITVGDEGGEYYDSFDEIPDDDDVSDGDAVAEDEDGGDEDEGLPWDDDAVAERSDDDDEETEEPAEAVEEEGDEEYDERDAEYDDAERNDFELSDDISGGTNVLDIVKKLGGVQKPQADGDAFFSLFGEGDVSEDEFRRAFSGEVKQSDIDEIMRQPLSQPEEPTKPKKHSKF